MDELNFKVKYDYAAQAMKRFEQALCEGKIQFIRKAPYSGCFSALSVYGTVMADWTIKIYRGADPRAHAQITIWLPIAIDNQHESDILYFMHNYGCAFWLYSGQLRNGDVCGPMCQWLANQFPLLKENFNTSKAIMINEDLMLNICAAVWQNLYFE